MFKYQTPSFCLDYEAADEFHIKEVYEQDVYGIRSITRGSSVIDLGANIGLFSLMCAHEFGCQVVAVEPDPRNFIMLLHNLKANPSLSGSVLPVNCAVSDKKEIAGFNSRSDHSGGSHLIKQLSPSVDIPAYFTTSSHSGVFNQVYVECLPIGEIFVKSGMGICDFMKLDCEGAEYFVFQEDNIQLLQTRVKRLAFECHAVSDAYYLSFLRGIGYEVTSVDYVIGKVIKAVNKSLV